MPDGVIKWRDALLSQGGLIIAFLFVLWAGYKQKWRWDREVSAVEKALAEMTADRNTWRDRCLRSYDDSLRLAGHAGARQ